MVIYSEDFSSSADGEQAYSILPEKTHKYSGYDATVKNQIFYIKRKITKQLLLMPKTEVFRLSLNLLYKIASKGNFDYANWIIYFGYDKFSRSGYKLSLKYENDSSMLNIALFEVDGVRQKEIGCQKINNVTVLQETKVAFSLVCKEERAKISIFDKMIYFDVKAKNGIIALADGGNACEIGFSDIVAEGKEFEKECIWKENFKIPRTDGGVLDYYLSIAIDKFKSEDDLYEINYELCGGAYENHTEFKGADCWVWEYDTFSKLYFSFGNERYYLSDKKLIFIDNDYQYFKKTLGGADIPYCGSFRVCKIPEFKNVFIGYDKRFSLCAGNLVSDRMYTYDKDGTLLFIGKALSEDCFFDVRSNPAKEIAKRIPKDNVDYDDALFHAQRNHYFLKDETPELFVDIYSKEDIRYLKIKTELENTWFEKIKELFPQRLSDSENLFEAYGYKKYSFSVKCDVHNQGVYHIKIICTIGNKERYEHTSAFEVIDDSLKESPQETAGLPNIYCGDGFPTKYSTYDLAAVRPDFNITHYINGSLHIPYYAEKRRTWELLKIYHRKSIIWMTARALRNRNETYHDYPNAVKYADYLNYPDPGIEDCGRYYRYETGTSDNFDGKSVRALYRSFLEENPELKEIFPSIENERIDPDKWAKIPCKEYDKWVTYINEKVRPWFVGQWKELEKINPMVKRFSYGPYPTYFSNHAGAYSTKWRGFSDEGLSEVFDGGFLKLEDYPFICGYQSHNCAWAMATVKLGQKDLCIAPDLYDSFEDDCPDGAVGFANPPMGESYAPPYQTVTQLYEYLYNTAVFDNNEFRFWDDNFINIYDHISREPEKRFEVFLRAWKIFLDNKPQRTLGKIAYIADFSTDEDRRSTEIDNISIYNRNQTAMSIIHEVNAEMGIPQGFVTDWNSFDTLDENTAEILILPSLGNVSEQTKEKIRAMHNNGCILIATGTVDGLEDIFGVVRNSKKKLTRTLFYKNKIENIYPYNSEYFYEENGADVVVSSECGGVIFAKGNTMLINVSLGEIGADSLVDAYELPFSERANISRVIRDAIRDFIFDRSLHIMHADEKCGINVIENKNGEKLIVLTDYSSYCDMKEHKVKVTFDKINVRGIKNLSYDLHDISLNIYEYNGKIDSFSVRIRPHEVLIFKIEE